MAIDLVCGMIVDEKSTPAKIYYDGGDYFFCTTYCREVFASEPKKYLEEQMEWGEAVDPVCGMTINISTAVAMSFPHDQFIYFCNETCKEIFDTSPEKYDVAEKEGGYETVAHFFERDLCKAELPVKGISSAASVTEIEKGLRMMNGTVDVGVDFTTMKATIYFDPSEVGMRDLKVTIKNLESRLRANPTKQPSKIGLSGSL